MLSKKYRVVNKKDFLTVFAARKRARLGPLTLYISENNLSYTRFGFVVPSAVSKKAVVRNRIRRRLHSVAQEQIPFVKIGYDCILQVYSGAEDMSFEEIRRYASDLLVKTNVLTKQ